MAHSSRVSIVIPSYLPDARLPAVVRELEDVLDGAGYGTQAEIIIVDDGTPQERRAGIRDAAAGSGICRVVRLRRNRGQQRATLAGIAAATGRVIVTMDDDGSHPPSVVPAMVSMIERGRPDLVYGAALPTGPRAGRPDRGPAAASRVRALGTRVNRAVFRLALGTRPRQPVTSFRAFRRELASEVTGTQRFRLPPNTSAILLANSPRVATVYYRPPHNRSRTGRPASRHSLSSLAASLLVLATLRAGRGLFRRALRSIAGDGNAPGGTAGGLDRRFVRPGRRERLMILGASRAQVGAIRSARRAGHRVVVVDRNPTAAGVAEADCFVCVSTFDEEGILAAARETRPAGILVVATDQPVLLASRVSAALGLPSALSPETAVLATNKAAMKDRLVESGVPTPPYSVVRTAGELGSRVQLPAVVKPVDNQGQRGVSLCHGPAELPGAVDRARRNSRESVVLIEQYYQSTEVTLSGWVSDGRLAILAVTDRVTIPSETSLGVCAAHRFPSSHAGGLGVGGGSQGVGGRGQAAGGGAPGPGRAGPEITLQEIARLAHRIVSGFGIGSGPVYLQMLLGREGIVVNEVACRLGGAFEDISLPLVTGIDILGRAIRECAGHAPPPLPTDEAGFVDAGGAFSVALLYAGEGTIAGFSDPAVARSLPGVVAMEWLQPVGRTIATMRDSSQRVGYAVVSGATGVEVNERLKALWPTLRVEDEDGENMLMNTLDLCTHPVAGGL